MSFTPIGIKDSGGSAVNMAAFQDAAGNNYPTHTGDTQIAHYRAGGTAFAMVATPTAAIKILGSATKTVRIKRIVLQGAATAAGNMAFTVKKNSTAGTIGSAVLTTVTATPLDSGNAAATGVVSTVGTANYGTVPTIVGSPLYAGRLQMTAIGTGVAIVPIVLEFGMHGRQALVLRGATENVTVDFGGSAIPSGGVLDFSVEWSEDAS